VVLTIKESVPFSLKSSKEKLSTLVKTMVLRSLAKPIDNREER
jgi:hypothetical protein